MDEQKLTALVKLNQLSLTDAERGRILAAFAQMSRGEAHGYDAADTERMVHVVPLTNVLREDISSQPFSRDSLLTGAPQQTDGCWQVPRLID